MSKHLTPQEFFHPLIQKHWYAICFFLILCLAAFLRFYKLGEVPAGMTWDEAAIGYNGHAIVRTRRDEWLVKLPVSFKSFGDFKAPLGIYISGIFTFIFGLNIWAVRLPFALAGVLTVAGMILIVEQFFRVTFPNKPSYYPKMLSVFAGGIIATSPWHLHFSRAGFESGMALCLVVWGVYFWQLGIFNNFSKGSLKLTKFISLNWMTVGWLFLAGVSFILSLYVYHSTKIATPLLLVALTVVWFAETRRKLVEVTAAILLSLPLLYPLIIDIIFAKGAERLNQISIFSTHSYWYSQLGIAFGNFFRHFSPNFLLFGQTTTLRHGDGYWGVLFLSEVFLVLVVLVGLIKNVLFQKNLHMLRSAEFKLLATAIVWIVVGFIPGSIGVEIPHANRALLAYPGFVILSVLGIHHIIQLFHDSKKQHIKSFLGFRLSVDDELNIFRIFLGMTILVHTLLFADYLHDYYTRYYRDSSQDFYYGYTQAFEYAKKYEDEVDKILFTSKYGQPYIFALFVRKTNPIWYQGGSLIKYEFTDKISEADLLREKTLVIGTTQEIPVEKADEIITAPNGQVKFVMVKND